jgi:hypothetical protein
LVYIKGKNIRMTVEFKVPIRHILMPTLSTNMVQHIWGEGGKRGALVENGKGPWQRNVVITNFEGFKKKIIGGGGEDEDKRR